MEKPSRESGPERERQRQHLLRAQHEFEIELAGIEKDAKATGHGAYSPGPFEMQRRIRWLHWLQSLGFDSQFIASVLQQATPNIHRVKELIARGYTPQQIQAKYAGFLADTEYDKERNHGPDD